MIVIRVLGFLCVSLFSHVYSMNQPEYDLSNREWDGFRYGDDVQRNIVTDIIKRYELKPLLYDAMCLDIGCGSGGVTDLFKALTGIKSIHGIDQSESMIQVAKIAYAVDGISFERLAVEDWHAEELYDVVVSFFTLHWIKDKKSFFEKVFRALKPGGCFIALCDAPMHRPHEHFTIGQLKKEFESFRKIFESGIDQESLLGRYRVIDHDLKELLTQENAIFTECTIDKHHYDLIFTQEEYGIFQRAQVYSRPFMNNIPEELHESFFQRFVTLMCESLRKTEDNKGIYPIECFVIKAFKPGVY